MLKRLAVVFATALLAAGGVPLAAAPAQAAGFGPTCQNVSVGSGVVARGCIAGSDTGCNPGTYTVSTWSLWNPTEAQGGATGTANVSGIFYTTAEPGHYYSVSNGGTGGQLYPNYGLCIDDTSTSKWEVQWRSTAGTLYTWCIYLVPGSGSTDTGPC